MAEKITIEIADTDAAKVRELNGGAWTDSAEFWADVVHWGLGALGAMKEADDAEKIQGPGRPVQSKPGEDPF